MSIGPAEIKQIGIALRMNFQDTFISETELSTERKKKTPIMVQRTGQKKIRENSRKVNHHFSKIKGLE